MVKKVLQAAASRRLRVYFRSIARYGCSGIFVDDTIFIDLERNISPARIFTHELLHFIYPKKSEREIYILEALVWKRMGQKDRYRLYQTLFRRKWRSNAD